MPEQDRWPMHHRDASGRSVIGRRETFAELVDRYRAPLHLLCYRLTGSFEDAIRVSYDTFLTCWRLRDSAPNDLSGWLTAMAVRAAVVHSGRHRPGRRESLSSESCIPRSDVTWLQPYPDRLLPDDADPDLIGLPFVAAIQSLTPRDRAAVVLADVEGWSLSRIAGALRLANADVSPRLERAKQTIRSGWQPAPMSSHTDGDLVATMMDAFAAADAPALNDLLHSDVQATMPPLPFSFEGRPAVAGVLAQVFRTSGGHGRSARRRCVSAPANRQPGFAVYVQPRPDSPYAGHELVVVRVEDGQVVEFTLFEPHLLPAFGLPTEL